LIDKLAELITGKPVPAPFIAGFIDSLHRRIEKYSKTYVLPAIKNTFEAVDANYIKEIHETAIKYNFHYGVIDLFKLIRECKDSKIRDYLEEKLSKRFEADELVENVRWLVNTKVYNAFEELKNKYQPREIEKDPLYKEEHLGKRLIDLIDFEPLARMMSARSEVAPRALSAHFPSPLPLARRASCSAPVTLAPSSAPRLAPPRS
jgi:hypothetical protein